MTTSSTNNDFSDINCGSRRGAKVFCPTSSAALPSPTTDSRSPLLQRRIRGNCLDKEIDWIWIHLSMLYLEEEIGYRSWMKKLDNEGGRNWMK